MQTEIAVPTRMPARHAAATIAIFTVLGPLIGLAIALGVLMPRGGHLSPIILAPATVLAYMFGGIPALLSGIAVTLWGGAHVWRRLRIAILAGVVVNAAVHGTLAVIGTGALLFSSTLAEVALSTVCAIVAAIVCTIVTQDFADTTANAD